MDDNAFTFEKMMLKGRAIKEEKVKKSTKCVTMEFRFCKTNIPPLVTKLICLNILLNHLLPSIKVDRIRILDVTNDDEDYIS